MKSILNTLISAIRIKLAKFILVFTKMMNPQYIKVLLQRNVGKFFSKILNVKPRDKKDYYTVFSWMFSKRLAYAIVVILGVACGFYIFMMSPARAVFAQGINSTIPTYSYDSWGVKNFTGQANIKAEEKYIAYTGDLEKGVVEGSGKLFDKEGNVVYEGKFAANLFNGVGQLNHKNGNAKYVGDFVNNVFQGKGKLYRENTSLEYDGEFASGLKHGDGMLYDETQTLIFTGKFENDEISYQTLLNKSTAENAQAYTGKSIIYNFAQGGDYTVSMKQIDALSVVNVDSKSILNEQPVEKIIVLKSALIAEKKELKTEEDLDRYFEKKIYEGLTTVQSGEIAAFLSLEEGSGDFIDKSSISMSRPFAEVCNVSSFDSRKEVYIRTYIKNGLVYTFYYADKKAPFVMYAIETAVVNE